MELKRPDIVIMAVATGVIVANIYYCQPLVILIAREFHISETAAGRITWLTQAGYASGLLFLVPLGDLFERKRQIVLTTMAAIVALVAASLAPGFLLLCIASYIIGFASVIPQLILPLAAHLASPERRGRIIGTVMSGLLIGILLSRTISGAIGAHLGWRMVYRIAALLCGTLLLLIANRFPVSRPSFKGTYAQLMKSLYTVVRTQPVLREASLINALAFALFGGFWTAMVLLLSGSPFHYRSDTIGLFGVVGAVGALAAPLVGRISDKHSPRKAVGYGLLITLAGTIFLFFGDRGVFFLITGILVLDLGQQAIHVSNQARVYALIPEARNRLNTVFMTSSFIGTASGSALALRLWDWNHWTGVSFGIIGLASTAIGVYAIGSIQRKSKPLC